MDLGYVWYMYNDIDWFNILHSTLPSTFSQGQGQGLS